jgi:hypothetical protein
VSRTACTAERPTSDTVSHSRRSEGDHFMSFACAAACHPPDCARASPRTT